jgi:hypothetical protein
MDLRTVFAELLKTILLTCPIGFRIMVTVMNIDTLIEKLINLKSQGVEELKVINDNWDNFDLDVASPTEVQEDDKTIGYLIVDPLPEY